MIEQVIDKPATESPARLTPQEVERVTQPLYERSLAEMKAEWRRRFEERRRKEQSPK